MEDNMSIIINFLMSGSVAILGIVSGYYIGNKKYVFEKTHDYKLLSIIDLYKQVVNLEFLLKEHVYFIGAETSKESIDKRIESLKKIKKNFQEFQHKFWEVEIILDEKSATYIEEFNNIYIQITSKLTVSNINQQIGDYSQSFKYWDDSFSLVASDLVKIKNELKKEFKKTLQTNS